MNGALWGPGDNSKAEREQAIRDLQGELRLLRNAATQLNKRAAWCAAAWPRLRSQASAARDEIRAFRDALRDDLAELLERAPSEQL